MSQSRYLKRLQCTMNRSNKFWEVEVIDRTVITRWGRIGTVGQAKTEVFENNQIALATADKKATDKTKKGYVPATTPTEVTARQVVRIVPLEDEGRRGRGSAIAQEALSNFFQERAQPTLKTQKRSRKSPPISPAVNTIAPGSPELLKPKRKVRI